MIRRMWLRLRMPCTEWPCRRCDRNGRTSWRSRRAWHLARRRSVLVISTGAILGLVVGLVVGALIRVVAW